MNAKTYRLISSWILLAVFLSMLVFTSFHIHPSYSYADETCNECVHHQCGGHISAAKISFHDCLLCQLSHAPFPIVQAIVYVSVPNLQTTLFVTPFQSTSSGVQGIILPRAPPVGATL